MHQPQDSASARSSTIARRWRAALGAGWAALLLGLAACGGGDTAATAADAGSTDASDIGAMPVLKFPK